MAIEARQRQSRGMMRANARAMLAAGEAEAASIIAEDIATDFGETEVDVVFLATCLQRSGNDPGAELVLRRCIETWPHHAPARFALAQLLSRQGKSLTAIAEARAALEIDPGLTKAAYFLGYHCRKNDDDIGAREAFDAAVFASPTAVKAHLGLAATCLRLGDDAAALQASKAVMSLDQDNQSAKTIQAQILTRRHRTVRVFLAEGQIPEALAMAGRIIEDFGETPENAVVLANCLACSGDLATAEIVYGAAVTLAPDDASVRLAFAKFLGENSKIAQALYEAEAADGLDPMSAAAPILVASLHRRAGDTVQAQAAFQRAAERDPCSVGAFAGLAATAQRFGDGGAALENAGRALALDPEFPPALRIRAIALAEGPASFEVRKAAFEAALLAAPKDLLLLRRYADAVLAAGDAEGAVAVLSKAETATDDPFDHARMFGRCANILARSGDATAARVWASRAAKAADEFNQDIDVSSKTKALISQAQDVSAGLPDISLERAMLSAAGHANAEPGDPDWALQRFNFGRLAAPWSLVASLAGPEMPDPWQDMVDDSALVAFNRERGSRPVLLTGGHIGPPVVLQNSFSRIAPDIHCLSSNSAFWLSRGTADRFIPAHFPSRAALAVFDRLRAGGTVFVGADGLLGARGLVGEAFGMPTNWPNGAATLARKTSALIYGCHALWDGSRIRIAISPGPDPRAFPSDEGWMAAFASWYGTMLQDILTADPANYRPGSYRYFGLAE